MRIDLNLENLNTETLKAVDFCNQIEIKFAQPNWLLGILFD